MKFKNVYGDSLSYEVSIQVCGGKPCEIGVDRNGNSAYFGHGWSAMCSYYEWEPRYMLNFKYISQDFFKVSVCDAQGHKVQYPGDKIRNLDKKGKGVARTPNSSDSEEVEYVGDELPEDAVNSEDEQRSESEMEDERSRKGKGKAKEKLEDKSAGRSINKDLNRVMFWKG